VTVSAGGDDSQYRPWFRFVRRHVRWYPPALMRFGHYALWLVIPFMAVVIANDAAGRPGWLTWAAGGAQFGWFGALFTNVSYHAARLCERCGRATPLDPQAAVEQWKPALRLEHRQGFVLVILAANLAWTLAAGSLLVNGTHALGLPAHHVIWAYLLQDVPAVLIISGFFLVERVHRDLYPWCPWCKWGKGGPPELVPDPDPAGTASR
jgi:hypothetical protein